MRSQLEVTEMLECNVICVEMECLVMVGQLKGMGTVT